MDDEKVKENIEAIISDINCPINYYIFRNTDNKEFIMKELTKIEQLGYQKP